MLKSKLFQIILAMLIVITLILVAFFLLLNYMDNKNASDSPGSIVEGVTGKQLSAAEELAMTAFLDEIVTNLAGNRNYIRASFAFQLDSKKAKEEFELLNYKIRALIIQTLADTKAEELSASKGRDDLLAELINKINPVLQKGNVKAIWITDWALD